MHKHGILPGWAAPVALLLVFGYLMLHLVHNQTSISAKRQELEALREQCATQEALNQELARALADDEDALIERIAREQGYARPNERIFVGY